MSIDLSVQHTRLATLVDLLQTRTLSQPEKDAYIFLRQGEAEEGHLTYRELDQHARALGALLQRKGAEGQPILLLHAPGLDYIIGFMGCLYAKAIAVPAYPPRSARMMPRIQGIIADTQAEIVLTTSDLLPNLQQWFRETQELQHVKMITTDNLSLQLADELRIPDISEDTLAFLQYTSGSTSTPKGVMVSHGNLIYNLSMLHQQCGQHENSHMVSWLPPYHDMGLIAGILLPMYGGCTSTLMSPMAFLQRPQRWLQAMSNYKATESFGPNFSFELCRRKATPEMLASLDLSHWKVAANGAEPVREETMQRFLETFAPCGLRPGAFFPGYGMAEATLLVATGDHTDPPVVISVSKAALEKGWGILYHEDEKDAVRIVGYERTPEDQKTIIVNPETMLPCLPGQVGEIWVGGKSPAQGYWQKPEASAETFQARLADTGEGPFLRTGDLGFIHDEVLFVTGRLKDLIVIRGLNHYPQDIEHTVENSHIALRPGCSAAFPIEIDGKEQLVIVAEVQTRYIPAQPHDKESNSATRISLDPQDIYKAIRLAVIEEHDLQVHQIQLIKAGHIFKTSSGKIQRRACKTAFLSKSLNNWNE